MSIVAFRGIDQIEKIGERVLTLERIFNIREGMLREEDTLPSRMLKEAIPDGPSKGFTITRSELEEMLKEYYELHGWDLVTGIPKRETLEALGIGHLWKDLEERER